MKDKLEGGVAGVGGKKRRKKIGFCHSWHTSGWTSISMNSEYLNGKAGLHSGLACHPMCILTRSKL